MSDLSNLTDEELKKSFGRSIDNERKATNIVLLHLREIEKRKLFSREGDSSLVAFCVREFGYSESAAWRRIRAMRLLRDVPQAHEQIVTGKISLSNLAKAESIFRLEKKKSQALSTEQKAEILQSIENKSQAEAIEHFGIAKMQTHLPSLR